MRPFTFIFTTRVLLQIICVLSSFAIVGQLISNDAFNWSPVFVGP
jgi:hypothetical protein